MITQLIPEITFLLPQCLGSQSVNVTDRQTDGRTDEQLSYSNTALRM